MQKEEFVQLVINELDYLKHNVSEKLLDRLYFETLEIDLHQHCIYGQMTGHSESVLAKELYPKSFEFVSKTITGEDFVSFEDQDFEKGENFTALEKYLYMVDSTKHEEIIDYLKGQSKEVLITL